MSAKKVFDFFGGGVVGDGVNWCRSLGVTLPSKFRLGPRGPLTWHLNATLKFNRVPVKTLNPRP